MVFGSHSCHMPPSQQFGCCLVLHLAKAWVAPVVPGWALAVLKKDLAFAHFGLAVLLFRRVSFAGLGVPVVVENPTGCSKHHRRLLLDFVDHHIEIQRSSENIQVARPQAEGLLDLVAARRGRADLFRCSMLLGLGTDGYHLLYRHHFRREEDFDV